MSVVVLVILLIVQTYIYLNNAFCFYTTGSRCCWQDANSTANDMVKVALNEKKRKLTSEIEADRQKLEAKKGKWSNSIIMDMEEVVQVKQKSLANIEEILSSATSESSKKQCQKFQQMKKRRATKLFEESRFKKEPRPIKAINH
jgi:hypothetical protein